VRDIRFHRRRSRDALCPPEPNLEAFLTDLAVNQQVAAATQHQAMNAQVFLNRRVLNHGLQGHIHAVRADKKINAPVVMTREDVASVIFLLDGTAQVGAKLLYGSGLRMMKAIQFRVQDSNVPMKQLTVRSGKGDKGRFTTVPVALTPWLQHHLAGVRALQQQDVAQGHSEVYRPHAMERKSPHAPEEWGGQSIFPARDLSVDPRAGVPRRHHLAPSVSNNAITVAVRRAGLTKRFSAHTLRHAFATHLRHRRTDIRTIQQRLGYQDLATTMIYTHGLQQGGQRVLGPLDDLGV
jgi:integron integrase